MKPIQNLGIGLPNYNKGHLGIFYMLLHAAIVHARYVCNVIPSYTWLVTENDAVDVARNRIVQNAREQNCDAIAYIDTDLFIPEDALTRLVMMSNAGHPIASGLYRKAKDPCILLCERMPGQWSTLEDLKEHEEGGLVNVFNIAGGFSIVRMEVYDLIEQKIGRPWYCNYDMQAGDQSYEDTYFFRRVRKLGVPIVVDPDLHAVHWSHFGPVPVVDGQPEMRYCV